MKKKAFTAIIVASMLASMGTGAYAATKMQEIKAFLNPDIKIKVDGTPVQLRDSNGNAIVPISYKNVTYLPVRAVSDAIDIAVQFDSSSNTVNLGEKVDGTSIAKNFSNMYHTKDPAHTTYKDKDYKEAYFDNHTGNRNSGFILNPKKQYQTLYLQIAAVGSDITDFEIKDTSGSVILKAIDVIKVEEGLTVIEVDIGGVDQLYINGSIKSDGAVFVPLTTSYYK